MPNTTAVDRNPIILLPGQLDDDTTECNTIHEGVQCDGNRCADVTDYIQGVRYKCSRCLNFDLCERCLDNPDDSHDRTHPLLRCLQRAIIVDMKQLPAAMDEAEAVRALTERFGHVVDLREAANKELGNFLVEEDGGGLVTWEQPLGTERGKESTLKDSSSSSTPPLTAVQKGKAVKRDGSEESGAQARSRALQGEVMEDFWELIQDGNRYHFQQPPEKGYGPGTTTVSEVPQEVTGHNVRLQDQRQDARCGIREVGPRPKSGGHVAVYNLELDTRTTVEFLSTDASRSTDAPRSNKTHTPDVHHQFDELIKVLCGQLKWHNYWEDEVFCEVLRKGKPATRVIELLPGEGEQKLQCQLITVDILEADAYEVICHDSSVNSSFQGSGLNLLDEESERAVRNKSDIKHPIYSSSGFLTMDLGLWNALRRLRCRDKSRRIWADQISVNESDMAEQKLQATYRRLVFSRAKRVLVWAGEEDKSTIAAISMFEKLAPRCSVPDHMLPSPEQLENDPQFGPAGCFEWVALYEFFKRPVFQRIWSIQEIVSAQDVVVVCGEYEIPWSSVENVAALLANAAWVSRWKAMAAPNEHGIPRHDLVVAMKMLREQQQARKLLPFTQLLKATQFFPVSDPRDMIFAILGLHPAGFEIMQPDYTMDVGKVFTDATKWILEHEKTFDIVGVASTPEDAAERSLPSWVPNYACSRHHRIMQLSLDEANYSASGGVPVSACWPLPEHANLLQTPSYHADTIIAVSKEPPVGRQNEKTLWWTSTVTSALGPRYTTGEATLEAFWRTCVVDASMHWRQQPAPTSYLHALGAFVLNLMLDMQQQNAGDGDDSRASPSVYSTFENQLQLELVQAFKSLSSPDQEKAVGLFNEVALHVAIATTGRNLFVTSGGYLCLTRSNAGVGDEVHVIPGAKTPFVLRKMEKQDWEEGCGDLSLYTVIGEAYVHGLMEGEALKLDGFKWTDIFLK